MQKLFCVYCCTFHTVVAVVTIISINNIIHQNISVKENDWPIENIGTTVTELVLETKH